MVQRDLREYLDWLDSEDLLQRIEGADWYLEIGGLNEVVMQRQRHPKALLFSDIKGYPENYRVLSNPDSTLLQWTKALGFNPTMDKKEAIIEFKNRSITKENTIPPREVSSGPILENVTDDPDVLEFPVPHWYEGDGGRYIGTADVVILRDPDTGEVNAGTYRVQTHDDDTVTIYISPGKDGRRIRQRYFDRGEACPVVISVGHPVDLYLIAGHRLPADVSELGYVGGIRGDGVEIIEGEETGLPIPARSEIILEGHIYPDTEPVIEGPFAEWTRLYAGGQHEEIPMTVEKVYHRDDPILLGMSGGRIPDSPVRKSLQVRVSAALWDQLDRSGVPGIREVNALDWGGGRWSTVISVDTQYGGHSRQVGYQAATGSANAYDGRYTIVVDDDVDVFSEHAVEWAIACLVDPKRDLHFIENSWSTRLNPTIPPERRQRDDWTNSRVIIDATRPYYFKDEYPPVVDVSDEVEQQIIEKWGSELDEVEEL